MLLRSIRTWGDNGSDLVWYESHGQGEFTEHVIITSETQYIHDLYLADLNGDGHVDMVAEASNRILGSSRLVSFENNGQGDFTQSTVWSGGTGYFEDDHYRADTFIDRFLVTDVTSDGHPDIVIMWGEEQYAGQVLLRELGAVDWCENDGSGRFHRNVLIAPTTYSNLGLNAADFDGDGDVDILVERMPSTWYENLSSVSYREIPDVDISTDEFLYGFASRRKGVVTVDATFDPTAGDVTLRLLDSQGQLVEEVTGTDGYLRIDHMVPAAGTAYEVQVTGTNTNVDLRICNLVSQDGNTVEVFDTDGNDGFLFTVSDTFNVTANGVDYHFDDASTFNFSSNAGVDSIELVDSSGDDTLTVSPTQMTMAGTPIGGAAYSATANGFRFAHGYARAGGSDTAQFVGSTKAERVKVYPTLVKMTGAGYYNRAKFFETVEVDMGAGRDAAVVAASTGTDVVWAMKDDLRVAYDVELAAGEGPAFEAVAYGVTITGAELVVARARGGDDWVELHDSPLNDVLIAKPNKVEMMNGPREGVTRASEYRITARGFGHVSSIADQGGDGDAAKLYDSGEDGVDLWAAGYLDGETWSTMTSPNRLLYEVLAFEHVGGYGFNGGLGEGHGTNRKEHAGDVDFVFQYGWWEGDEEPPVPNPRNPRG